MPLRARALLICLALVGSLTLQLPTAHAAGSPRWTEISASSSAMFGGRLYFFADDGIHGKELWRTDGTLGGTELVVDSNPGNSVSDTRLDKIIPTPSGLVLLDTSTRAGTFNPLDSFWKLVETGSSRTLVAAADPFKAGTYKVLSTLPGKILFTGGTSGPSPSGNNNQLYALNTATNTVTKVGGDNLHNLAPGATLGNHAYYARAASGISNVELWRSDGTGHELVKDIRPSGSSSPKQFVATANLVYFIANDGVHGEELWTTNGTSGGTVRLTDHVAGTADSKFVEFAAVGSRLYYTIVKNGVRQLWRTDGTAATTAQVAVSGTTPRSLTPVADYLAFFTDEGQWATGGNLGTTIRVNSSSSAAANNTPIAINNQIVYVGWSGFTLGVLWQGGRTAGTAFHHGSFSMDQPMAVGRTAFFTVPETGAGIYRVPRFVDISTGKPVIKVTKAPTVIGKPIAKATLTLQPGTWTPRGTKLTYQWYVSGKKVKGKTGLTFKVAKSHVGKKVHVVVTGSYPGAKNASKATTSLTIKRTIKVSARPKISGTAKVGKTLKATAPRVSSPSKTSKSYRWYADGVAIAKATKKTYVLISADVGKSITLRVTVKKKSYLTVVSTSKATAKVKAP